MHGIKNTGSIDHKIMMLMKFIEIVDGTYTMRWEKTRENMEKFNIQPGDTLLILGEENKGLIISRPELLRDLADEIFSGDK